MSDNSGAVTLRLFGPLRDAVGRREVSIACGECTVMTALTQFADDSSEMVRQLVFDGQGNQRRSLILLVNDEPVQDSRETRVRAGDVISLLLPLAGG